MGFDVGGHTVSHIDMAKTDTDTVRRELCESKATLEHQLGQPVQLFAYPFGGRQHMSPVALQLVREAGYVSCASAYGGLNPCRADAYDLKRVGISDWFADPYQFGAELLLGRI
jgi:peptidoglycan/xylan/chitin deacetylase (PgdA/CDA1 family)